VLPSINSFFLCITATEIMFLWNYSNIIRFFYIKLQTRNKRYNEICTLLGYYVLSCGNCLPTFRDNLLVPSSWVKVSFGSYLPGQGYKGQYLKSWDLHSKTL
jgi:hypothetical protein